MRPTPAQDDRDRPAEDDAAFLAALGQRVRDTRSARGVTRKALAERSGVSERYLAQLEAGEGNSSIILLRRVAGALAVPLEDLLSASALPAEWRWLGRLVEAQPPSQREETLRRLRRDLGEGAPPRDRVALVGLRGAGKSTLGPALAEALGVPFVELDREIERDAGMTLPEILNLYGQGGYRRVEQRCLERVLGALPRAIIAASGGIVSEPDTYRLLRLHCFTVWLKAAPAEHMARVVAQGDLRPMSGNTEAMEDLRRILEAREPLYGKADATVDTTGQSVARSLAVLKKTVTEAGICRAPAESHP